MGSKPPKPPNPERTAAAQTGTNIGTALANNSISMVGQSTPDHELRYDVVGHTAWRDPNSGKVYQLPRYKATQTLSGTNQSIYDAQKGADLNLAQLAETQSGRLGDLLSAPLSLDNDATESRLMELGISRLQPELDRRREARAVDLANKGIHEGSAAYDRAMTRLDGSESDAINGLLLSGRQQAVQEALLERNQPINEIIGIGTGTQIASPQWVNTQTAKVGTPDIAGLTMANYQHELNAYNQRQQQLGGLFGTIATGIAMSDRRIKTGIREVGRLGDLPIVSFRYVFDDTNKERMGFVAQDVEKIYPQAVTDQNGLLAVDYDWIAAQAQIDGLVPEFFEDV